MTTAVWSTAYNQNSDAGYRAWVAEFISYCLAVGLVQTADTGQINTATATRPAVNTSGGYAIFYLNDSLFSTAPIYMKFDFRSGAVQTTPVLGVQVGTGSDGAGTLTGTGSISNLTNAQNSISNTATAYISQMCATEGFFGFAWKTGVGGNQNANRGAFYVQRTHTSLGVADGSGYFALWGGGSPTGYSQQQFFSISLAQSYTANSLIARFPCVIPGAVTSSLLPSGDTQAYTHQMATPDVRFCVGTCTVLAAEAAQGTQFTMAILGGVNRNYIALGGVHAAETTGQGTVYNPAMLWE